MPHQVILVGASGLIGSHLLTQLIESDDISRILLLLRKPLNISAPKVQELIVNFDELKNLSILSLHIYQPSLLTGNRKESRLGDKFAISVFKLIDALLIGPFKKYRSIEAEIVARVMLNQSLKDLKGTFIYPSIQIQKLV